MRLVQATISLWPLLFRNHAIHTSTTLVLRLTYIPQRVELSMNFSLAHSTRPATFVHPFTAVTQSRNSKSKAAKKLNHLAIYDCRAKITIPQAAVSLSAPPAQLIFWFRGSLPCNGRNISSTINSRTKQSNRNFYFASFLCIFEFVWSCRSKYTNRQQDRVSSEVDTKRLALLRTARRRGDGRGPFADAPAETGTGYRAE